MKKISIIIPVYNVEKYIEKTLKSLVNQTLKDIEVIIVNDGSTDGSQTIIDKYKNMHPEIIKSYYIKNGGAAKARNYGLKFVTGEYIGFVDSDDYISEDMYEKLYEEAKNKQSDIVCCNYYRVIDNIKFNKKQFGNKNINKDNIFDKNIYESNMIFDEVPYLWNKIFKTKLIKDNDFKFCDDLRIYEDLLFTYEVFSKANKISKIDDALYYYIVSRNDSLTHILTEKRFDIFKATKMLIEYYNKIGRYDEVKDALTYVLLKHIYVILEKITLKQEKKLKLKYIDEVFKFLECDFPEWKNNMYFELQLKNKKKYTSKLYWKIYTCLGFDIGKKLKEIKKEIKKIFKFIFIEKPGYTYMKQAKKAIDEKSVFIFSQQGNNLNGNMFYILKELATNKIYDEFKIYIGYTRKNKVKFKQLLKNYNILGRVKFVENKTNRFAKILAKSKYLFTDTSMPTYFIKRKEQIYLNTWHGTPLKTLGKSTENDFFDIANVQKNFAIADYLLYPSEYMKNIMIKDYMLEEIAHNKIMLCGYPRNEIFLRDNIIEEKKKNNLDNKTIIAYMPTWRGSVRNIDIQTQIDIAQDHIKQISESLTENQILYVNMHPFIGNKLDLNIYENVKVFPKNIETYDFLSLCDILITDYSSVFFDFAITNKKIILFTYDEEEYFKQRGVYIKLKELPFPKVKNIQELINEINSPIQYNYDVFLEKFCKYERKDISKLICEKVFFNKENEIKVIEMENSNKENVLIYLGDFRPNNTTKNFLKVVENTQQLNYNYLISYITKDIRKNKEIFKKVINKINFYGQLGNNTNLSKSDRLFIKLLQNRKKIYSKFEKKYEKIHKNELDRIYQDIKFKAAILYGDVEDKKIYQLSKLECKKILYIMDKSCFNTNVNKEIYNKFSYILVTNKKAFEKVKEYCGENNNIKLVNNIKDLNDFNQYINE